MRDHGHDHSHNADHARHERSDPPGPPRPHKQEQEDASTEITEVAHGILRSQLPIAMPGLGHVNCCLLEDEHGVAVVDPGLPGDESERALVDRLGRAGYLVADVHTIVVTHSHPDHYGSAMRLRHETGADVVTHETFRTIWEADALDDEDSATLAINSPDDQAAALERDFSRPSPWGGTCARPSPEFLERMLTAGEPTGGTFAIPGPTMPLTDGQTIKLARREWVAMHTPGHTYDHLCLDDPDHGVVLTGDHVLPSIAAHQRPDTPARSARRVLRIARADGRTRCRVDRATGAR